MGSKKVIYLSDGNGGSSGAVQVIDTRNLADAQNDALNRLNNQYNGLYASGFNYNGQNFQIDPDSQAKINAACSMAMAIQASGAQWPANYTWIASDNTTMSLGTVAAVLTFGLGVGQYVTSLVLTNRAMKDAIASLPDIPSCDAFNVASGWPSN